MRPKRASKAREEKATRESTIDERDSKRESKRLCKRERYMGE